MSSSLLISNITVTVLKITVIDIYYVFIYSVFPLALTSAVQPDKFQHLRARIPLPNIKLGLWCRITWRAAWSVAYICPCITDGPWLDITQLCRWVSADIVKILKVSPRAACCCSWFHLSEDGVPTISSCDLQVCQLQRYHLYICAFEAHSQTSVQWNWQLHSFKYLTFLIGHLIDCRTQWATLLLVL